jgi:hypothetical protein
MTAPPADAELARMLRRIGRSTDRVPDDNAARPVIAELVRRGLAERTGERLRATQTGVAFLRRFLAGDDRFAAQHQDRGHVALDEEDGRRMVLVNRDESPLAWLRRHKGRDGRPMIDANEFAAGERFRSDYTRAQIMPRVTANWSAAVATGRRDGGVADLTDAVIAARQRVGRALDATGPELGTVLVDFCCFLMGIEEIERKRQWPVRSAKLVIRLALAALARHYGLTGAARGPERAGPIRHWGAEDYRPSME